MILYSITKAESDQLTIYGIKKGDKLIIEKVYQDYFSLISTYIKRNSGSYEDARDIFQEALIIIYHNVRRDDFELECKFSTYLYSICKNLWLKQLRDQPSRSIDSSHLQELTFDCNTEQVVQEGLKYEVYLKKFESLSNVCKEVLRLYFAKINMRSIARTLNLSSESYAKKKKFKCKEQLIKSVKEELTVLQKLA